MCACSKRGCKNSCSRTVQEQNTTNVRALGIHHAYTIVKNAHFVCSVGVLHVVGQRGRPHRSLHHKDLCRVPVKRIDAYESVPRARKGVAWCRRRATIRHRTYNGSAACGRAGLGSEGCSHTKGRRASLRRWSRYACQGEGPWLFCCPSAPPAGLKTWCCQYARRHGRSCLPGCAPHARRPPTAAPRTAWPQLSFQSRDFLVKRGSRGGGSDGETTERVGKGRAEVTTTRN